VLQVCLSPSVGLNFFTAPVTGGPATTAAPQVTVNPGEEPNLAILFFTGSSGNCEALLSGKSGWSGNFGATLNIPVSTDLSSYELKLETSLPLTNIVFWEADVSPATGSSFTVKSKSWFGGAQAGSSLALGFQVTSFPPFILPQVGFSGTTDPAFTSITLNGVKIC